MSSSANSSLRPAWRNSSGGRGFQPPPTVASERTRNRSQSFGSSGDEKGAATTTHNKFAALDDDEDVALEVAASQPPPPPKAMNNTRSEALRQGIGSRAASTGSRTGRSLADLAAQARPPPAAERAPSFGNRFSALRSTTATADADAGKPVIRYTREKLLSMRPAPSDTVPEQLIPLQGSVILSTEPQDPVCWDAFDADEIWASVPLRRSATKAVPPGIGRGLGDIADGDLGPRRVSVGSARRDTSSNAGRWQRGVALPPPSAAADGKSSRREKESDNPDDLWDDPITGGPAADFSSFIMPDEKGGNGGAPAEDVFDFEKMAEESRLLEEEMHGPREPSSANDDETGGDESAALAKSINPRRPLASAGTTIKSGSGDDVNIFEDFDDPAAETASTSEADAAAAIKSATENANAASRLMKVIGAGSSDEMDTAPSSTASAPELVAAPEPSLTSPWGVPNTNASLTSGVSNDGIAIPLNPWGGTLLPTSTPRDDDLQSRLRQAEMEQKARQTEMARRRQELEAQKRAQEQAQQQEALRQQQQQQLEMVLMERISTILENSWGRASLMSILTTLHAEDSRVVPLLDTVDALRALILRNSRRVSVRHDQAFGAEVAVLLITNEQWQQEQRQQQQQVQQQAQARVQQDEIRRRELQRAEEQKAAAARAQSVPIVPGAPWYYSDPQNNIQGPFRGEEMRQWLEAGYFKGDLPISQESGGPFRQLSSIYPDISSAFMTQADQEHAAKEEAHAKTEEDNRRLAEAQARSTAEAAERERQAKEAAERARKEAEAAAAAEEEAAKGRANDSSAKNNSKKKNGNGGNESSAQLKMMLGLPSQGGSSNPESKPEPAVAKRASKTAKKPAQQLPPAQTAPEPASAPAVPVWGAASKPVAKKSMSEIQQEEARKTALIAKQQGPARSSSSGWANVASASSKTPASGWSSGAVKQTQPVAVSQAAVAPAPVQTRQRSQTNVAAINVQAAAATKQRSGSTAASNKSSTADDFGAKMSPTLEQWCKEQMIKLNGSDDLTLLSFCMTLTDSSEIREYLTTYLGSTPQVNSFAGEFINRKMGKNVQDEWETTASAKKKGKKKVGGR